MSNDITRRSFLKSMAMATAGTAVSTSSFAGEAMASDDAQQLKYPDFRFKNGKFRIMQFTDTHFIAGNANAKRAIENVREMLDAEKPDLVIHTGDIIFGEPAKESLTELLKTIGDRRIPWAVALGNHDGQFGMSRKEVYDYVRTLPYNINTPQKKDVYGDSNDLITLSSTDGKKQWAFYLLDTGENYKDENIDVYEYLRFSQVAWYRQESMRLTQENGGKPLKAMAFMHIPFLEYMDALSDSHHILKGNWGEEPCPSKVNSGMFSAMYEMGDVMAMVSGHDHDDDFVMKWRGRYLIYGRYSGGDTVYNNLRPNGCRMFEITEGEDGFRTYIRLSGGKTEQDLNIPDSFKKY